jgi:hypothetical protein
MAIVKIKAKDAFSHGRLNMARGETANINKIEAEDLEKAGLVAIEGDAGEDSLDDLVGGKAEPILANKMDKPVANKGSGNSKK